VAAEVAAEKKPPRLTPLWRTGYTYIMEPTDLTIHVLREIRDELRGLKQTTEERFERLEQQQVETNARLESLERTTNERFDRLEGRMDRHETILERHEKALSLLINEVRGLGSRIDNLVTGPMGEKVRELDRRVATLESRAGIGQP
jgi:DNA repair exonuclease SbcCD ATPase subunit